MQSEHWLFTLNNPEWEPTMQKGCSYLVWAPQVGEQGTPHYQCYCQTTNLKGKNAEFAKKMVGWRQGMKDFKMMLCAGSSAQNIAYIVDDEKKTNVGEPRIWGTPRDIAERKKKGPQQKHKREREAVNEVWLARKKTRYSIDWPLKIFTDLEMQAPSLERKRHIWLWGAGGLGKSPYIIEMLRWRAVHIVPGTKYRLENYQNEELLLWDDVVPTREEIIKMANDHKGVVEEVPGEARYDPKYHTDVMVNHLVIHNKKPEELGLPAEVISRFTVYEIDFQCFNNEKSIQREELEPLWQDEKIRIPAKKKNSN